MKSQHTNSTFASSNTQADTSACKRAISCHSHGAKKKRTDSTKKQPFQLTNFCPFGAVTAWTWRKCIRVIIKSDYFSTFYAFVATLTGFFSSCVHKFKFRKLKTRSISTLDIRTLLATFLCRTDFHFLSDSSSRSSYCFPRWNKLSSTGISYSRRCFTHVISIYRLILCPQLHRTESLSFFIHLYICETVTTQFKKINVTNYHTYY